MRVGIFGGSFNPVHKGHLKLAQHAYDELNLDKVIFVPSCHTPLKSNAELLPADLRLRLLREAVKKNKHFSVSDLEIKRGGFSYTVESLRFFKKKFGKDATLFFLAGADSLKNISRWKSVRRIFALSRFVVATRPGVLLRNTSWPVLRMPFDAADISASDIRKKLSEKKDIRSLVPSGTAKILKEYYRSIEESM